MDLSLILTIFFGFIGVIGLFITWKAWFRPKIQLIVENTTALTNLGDFSSPITVKYEKEDISKNLFLISGYMINVGNVDIDKRDVENPINLVLPKNSKWHSFKILSNKSNMNINEFYTESSLEVNVGLWKKNEGFKFDALISLDVEGVENKNFDFLHVSSRIKGVDNITIVPLQKEKKFSNKWTKFFNKYSINILLIVYIFLASILYSGFLDKDKYEFVVYDSNKKIVLLDSNHGNPIVQNDSGIINSDKDGFYNLYINVQKIETKKHDKVLAVIIFLFSIFVFIIVNFKEFKNHRIRVKVTKI